MLSSGITGIKNLSLSFGTKAVFSDRSIIIEEKEHICLNGPSGSGKTTFLNLLMGFELPDSGEVFVGGKILVSKNIRAVRNLISWLPQDIQLEAETGKDLLLAPLSFNANKSKMPDEKKIENLLSDLLLDTSLLSQKTDTLSGGQKQRLAIGGCILLDKPLLLLDEPSSALDDEAVTALGALFAKLRDKTIISVSHDERWIRMMDRLITIDLNKQGNGSNI